MKRCTVCRGPLRDYRQVFFLTPPQDSGPRVTHAVQFTFRPKPGLQDYPVNFIFRLTANLVRLLAADLRRQGFPIAPPGPPSDLDSNLLLLAGRFLKDQAFIASLLRRQVTLLHALVPPAVDRFRSLLLQSRTTGDALDNVLLEFTSPPPEPRVSIAELELCVDRYLADPASYLDPLYQAARRTNPGTRFYRKRGQEPGRWEGFWGHARTRVRSKAYIKAGHVLRFEDVVTGSAIGKQRFIDPGDAARTLGIIAALVTRFAETWSVVEAQTQYTTADIESLDWMKFIDSLPRRPNSKRYRSAIDLLLHLFAHVVPISDLKLWSRLLGTLRSLGFFQTIQVGRQRFGRVLWHRLVPVVRALSTDPGGNRGRRVRPFRVPLGCACPGKYQLLDSGPASPEEQVAGDGR